MLGEAATAAVSLQAPYTSLWSVLTEWCTPMVFFVLLNVVIGTIAVTSKSVSHAHTYTHGIAGKSATADHHHHHYHDAAPPPARQLSRTASMLQRLKSFNLNFHMYRYRPEDYGVVAVPPDATTAAAHASVVDSVEAQKPATAAQRPVPRRDPSPPPNLQQHLTESEQPQVADDDAAAAAEFDTLEEAFLAASAGSNPAHLNRIPSDTHPTADEMPRRYLAATMKKSASTKSAFSHFQPRDLPKRPETTREDRRHHWLDPDEDGDDQQAVAQQPQHGDHVDARADDFINRFRQQLKLQRLESLMRYRDMLDRGR